MKKLYRIRKKPECGFGTKGTRRGNKETEYG